MAAFTGTLNTNEFYNALYNAYKLITTFADGLDGLDTSLANKFKADGGKYRDTSVWTDSDILTSRAWDPTKTNVLIKEETVAPKQQKITVDQKRQIALNTELYLARRAWGTPEAYESFNSVVQSQVSNTKKVYEQRLVSVAVGTMVAEMPSGKGSGQAQNISIGSSDGETLRVRKIGKAIANLLVNVKDSTRDYNDYGFMKAYSKDKLMIIWNASYLNEFNYVDLPALYHKDGVIDFVGEQLPGRYFGDIATSSDVGSGKIINASGAYDNTYGTLRFLQDTRIGGSVPSGGDYETGGTYYFAGDIIPNGTTVYADDAFTIPCYIENSKIIGKIMHKDSIKYLTSWQTSTEFFNPKNLSTNRYLTFCYAKPDYLRNYPLITLKEVTA